MNIPYRHIGRFTSLLATLVFFIFSTAPGLSLAEEEAPQAEESGSADAPAAKRTYRRGSDDYRARMDRMRDRRKAWNDRQREARERWRSYRRWWNDPVDEDRRQWLKARQRWNRETMDARRDYQRNNRPYYHYGRGFDSRSGQAYESFRYYP